MKRFFLTFFIVGTLISVLVPFNEASAQWVPGQPLVPCGLRTDDPDSTNINESLDCTPCGLLTLGRNIIDFILIGLMPPLATLFFIWGGFQIMTSGANIGSVSHGREIMWTTFMGIVVMLCSWLIVNTLLSSLSPGGVFQNWWQFQCTWDTTTTEGGNVPITPGTTAGPAGVCPQSGLALCQGDPAMNCNISACAQYAGAISQHAGGVATASLLRALMIAESSCNISSVSPVGAAGLMQLRPSTANVYRQYCNIPSNVSITAAWLTNPANANSSICLASQYIQRGLAPSSCGTSPQNIIAGYNAGPVYCQPSRDCTGASCTGGTIRRWECLYDDANHTICNTGLVETRNHVRRVTQCMN